MAVSTHRTTQTQNKRTNIHVSNEIRTHDFNVWAGEDSSCLGPRGRCHRPDLFYLFQIHMKCCRTLFEDTEIITTLPLFDEWTSLCHIHLMTFHSYDTNLAGDRSDAEQPKYVSRLITKQSVDVKLLYTLFRMYGDHVNKTLERSDSVCYSHCLTSRESALPAVRAMPLFIATAAHWQWRTQCPGGYNWATLFLGM
jgi:hypothetical protein